MNKPEKLYIERMTQDGRFLNHKGPAVIADVTYSKTGRTIYYKGLRLKRSSSNEQSCIYGNHYNDPGDEFWVSGVKKRGSNRYPGFERFPVTENGEL
tara:strand:+ start:3033 stop:3323 length:291 start_codon:yes stop_codon:yes gene_type:complete